MPCCPCPSSYLTKTTCEMECHIPIPIPPMCCGTVCPPLREGGAPDPCTYPYWRIPCCYPCYI